MRSRRLLPLASLLVACSGDITDATLDASIDATTSVPSDAEIADAGDPAAARLAEGVALDGLAAFQGVRVELARGGVAVTTRNAPIVAERDVLVRLYVTPMAGWVPRSIRGEVVIREGARVVAVHGAERTITAPTSDADPSSAIDVLVPAAEITPTVELEARLVDPSGAAATAAAHPARIPRDGSVLALGAQSDLGGLELVLVPLLWQSDGSNRAPDTSEAQIATIRALLLSLYPIAHLSIRVREPVPWAGGLTFTGNVDFGDVNSMLLDLRAADGASDREYYYALVEPAGSFDAYCGGSCVTGQSYVVDAPGDGAYRVGSGVGFSGESSAWTLAHEVGHEHGRAHAPCGASGSDAAFPYASGGVGVWGWDARNGELHDPAATKDFMGYCEPTWISDYTWSAMFERTTAVRALSAPAARTPRDLVRLRVATDGVRWAGTMRAVAPTTRETATLAWLDARGAVIALELAPALPLSHGDEHLVLGTAPESAREARVTLGGASHTIALPL